MKCRDCNTIIADTAKFCHNCGQSVKMLFPNRIGPFEDAKFGYVDDTGIVVIPHIFRWGSNFKNGFALVLDNSGKWLVIDREGNAKKIDCTHIDYPHDGLALVNRGGQFDHEEDHNLHGGLYGYIDESGQEIIPVVYRDATRFKNGYAAVKVFINNQLMWIFIDRYGKQISKDAYSDIGLYLFVGFGYGFSPDVQTEEGQDFLYLHRFAQWGFYNNRARVCNGRKWGYIDTNGERIIPFLFDDALHFLHEKYTTVQLGNKWGIIDCFGNSITSFIYDDIRLYIDNTNVIYASLKKDNKCEVLKIENTKINTIIPSDYSDDCFVDVNRKVIIVRQAERYGIYDMAGKVIIPFFYRFIDYLVSTEFLVVSDYGEHWKNGAEFEDWRNDFYVYRCEVIDWSNKILIPYSFEIIYTDKSSLIDEEHFYLFYDRLLSKTYEHYCLFSEGHFWIRKDGKCGTINLKGNAMIPCVYDWVVSIFENGVATVVRDGNRFFIDYYGNEIPCDIWIDNEVDHEQFINVVKQLLSLKANRENLLYLFLDTETTGVPQNYKAPISDLNNWPRLVQLAGILCDEGGNEILCHSEIIKPDGFSIPIEASNLHKITTNIALEKGVDLQEALHRFVNAAELADVIICHNVEFDIKIVGAELLRIGNDFRIDKKPLICTMSKSKNFCAIPNPYKYKYDEPFKWPKLQELHKKLFGVEFEEAHDAMADVKATKKCFFELQRLKIIPRETFLDKKVRLSMEEDAKAGRKVKLEDFYYKIWTDVLLDTDYFCDT